MSRIHLTFAGLCVGLGTLLTGCGLFSSTSAATPSVHVISTKQGPDESLSGMNPPDTQIAAGPNNVIVATNGAIFVYSNSGALVDKTSPQVFLGVAKQGALVDPQYFYDAHTKRFFASEDLGGNKSGLDVAVSKSSDPLKGWTTEFIPYSPNFCPDQPHLGLSNTAIGVGVFLYPGLCGNPSGNPRADLFIVDKQALMSGNTKAAHDEFNASYSQADFPLTNLDSSPNLYVLHYTSPSSPISTAYMSVYVGTPPSGTFVSKKYVTVPIPAMSSPPDSTDVEPHNLQLDLNDDRPRSGVVVGNTAYVAQQVVCKPKGDSQVRSCARILALDVANSKLIAAKTLAVKGESIAYPGITADSSGNVWVIAQYFSPSLNPGALAAVYSHNLARRSKVVVVQRGNAPVISGAPFNRFGDYSGAARDATSSTQVWLATEYGKSSDNWGTVIAHLKT